MSQLHSRVAAMQLPFEGSPLSDMERARADFEAEVSTAGKATCPCCGRVENTKTFKPYASMVRWLERVFQRFGTSPWTMKQAAEAVGIPYGGDYAKAAFWGWLEKVEDAEGRKCWRFTDELYRFLYLGEAYPEVTIRRNRVVSASPWVFTRESVDPIYAGERRRDDCGEVSQPMGWEGHPERRAHG